MNENITTCTEQAVADCDAINAATTEGFDTIDEVITFAKSVVTAEARLIVGSGHFYMDNKADHKYRFCSDPASNFMLDENGQHLLFSRTDYLVVVEDVDSTTAYSNTDQWPFTVTVKE